MKSTQPPALSTILTTTLIISALILTNTRVQTKRIRKAQLDRYRISSFPNLANFYKIPGDSIKADFNLLEDDEAKKADLIELSSTMPMPMNITQKSYSKLFRIKKEDLFYDLVIRVQKRGVSKIMVSIREKISPRFETFDTNFFQVFANDFDYVGANDLENHFVVKKRFTTQG